MPLDAIPRRLLRDQAYEALLDAIISGELQPGQVVHDVDLATRVGLSRTPVREALARLADEGLIESKPNAYTRVTELLRQDCHDAYVVVRALHVLAITEALPALTEADLERMRAANRRFAAAVAGADVHAAVRADDELHAVVLERAGNAALIAALERLTPRIRRLERLRFGSPPGRDSVGTHERIIAACERGDAEAAARFVHENWSALGRLIDEAFPSPTTGARDDPADHRAGR